MQISKVESSLEDLSNEIFMEVFDYLPGHTIFCSFFHLNHRFEFLCNHYPTVHIDTTDPSLSLRTFRRFKHSMPSKHIRSLKFSAEKCISRIPIKYFTSLHSLTFINSENPTRIKEFLEKLPSPHQLHHLIIKFKAYAVPAQDLVTTIFKFTSLNRLELYAPGNRLDNTENSHPLLTLQYLKTVCYQYNDLSKLVPFLPNLITLNIMTEKWGLYSNYIFAQPNSLSKLRILRMIYVQEYHQIEAVFRLCPQVNKFKVQCLGTGVTHSMIKAKDWEQLLKPMKFLKTIEINVRRLFHGDAIDLSEYDTEFWIQRNLRAIQYTDPKANEFISYPSNYNALLIK